MQQPSARLPELNSGRRETGMDNDNGIDWIVRKGEVSNHLILDLNRVNSFKLKQGLTVTSLRMTNMLQKPSGRDVH